MYCFAQKMHEMGLAKCAVFPEYSPEKIIVPDWEGNLFKDSLGDLSRYVEWADFVVCQYISTPEGLSLVEAIKDFKPCFMEVDDYFPQIPSYSVAYDQNSPGDRQHFWGTRQLIMSTGVITTTQYLADCYTEFNTNIHVIPNCIDFDLWDEAERENHPLIRIGWIGGATHEYDLKIVKKILYRILERNKNVEVYIVSGPPPAWEETDRLCLSGRWTTIDRYPAYLKSLGYDIGVAPLRDNYFNRAKSNLRYLEYAACSTPTVSSNVEPFKHDFVGIIAETDLEWESTLQELIDNEEWRLKLGGLAYDSARQMFNLDDIAKQYASLIGRTLDGSTNTSKYSNESVEVRSRNSNIC